MAEFCSLCEPDRYDIDLISLALHLERGHSENILCEGCSIKAIYKDEQGNLFLCKNENNTLHFESINIDNL